MSDQKFFLLVQRGPEPGKAHTLSSSEIIIGRDPMSDITITDPEVSRQHVRLIQSQSGYSIQDLGSTNGTFVDGQRLGGEPVQLKPGQTIAMGAGVTLRFDVRQAEREEPKTVLDSSPFAQDLDQESVIESDTNSEPPEQDSSSQFLFEEIDDPVPGPSPVSQEDEVGLPAVDPRDDDLPEELSEEQADASSEQQVNGPDDSTFSAEEDQSEAFVESRGEAVVIPHTGEPDLEQKDRRTWRAPAIITSLLLLIICCCCSFILFIYYYGGDWVLRQMGLLP